MSGVNDTLSIPWRPLQEFFPLYLRVYLGSKLLEFLIVIQGFQIRVWNSSG